VDLPAEPPSFSPEAARVLLRILTKAAADGNAQALADPPG
jgi:hypothetical protein